MTRKQFIQTSFAASILPTCFATPSAPARWYKGMLHCHSFWSDGRGFPEDAAAAYKALGYNFLAITDHNSVNTDPARWRDVEPEEGTWPPKVSQPLFDHYRNTFHADTRATPNGKTQVRLKTTDELKRQFDDPERFLLMHGVEITQSMPGKDRHDLHVNYINIPELLPFEVGANIISDHPDRSVRDMLRRDFDAYDALRTRHNRPAIFMLNHPHWPMMDILPDDLLDVPEVRFFEICNNGADLPLPKALIQQPTTNNQLPTTNHQHPLDLFWDAVNAERARRNIPLLFAIANDDTHWYPGNGHTRPPRATSTPGDGYIRVRANALDPQSLFDAMHRGDFYASSGVDLQDVAFDGESLAVAVPAKPGVRYTIRFIVSKREFLPPVSLGAETYVIYDQPRHRALYRPGRGVGEVAEVFTGKPGEPLRASYRLRHDDLYVRARIESDEPAYYTPVPSFHPATQCAWTQPYRPRSQP